MEFGLGDEGAPIVNFDKNCVLKFYGIYDRTGYRDGIKRPEFISYKKIGEFLEQTSN